MNRIVNDREVVIVHRKQGQPAAMIPVYFPQARYHY
jgi:hypothetical protein